MVLFWVFFRVWRKPTGTHQTNWNFIHGEEIATKHTNNNSLTKTHNLPLPAIVQPSIVPMILFPHSQFSSVTSHCMDWSRTKLHPNTEKYNSLLVHTWQAVKVSYLDETWKAFPKLHVGNNIHTRLFVVCFHYNDPDDNINSNANNEPKILMIELAISSRISYFWYEALTIQLQQCLLHQQELHSGSFYLDTHPLSGHGISGYALE